MNSKRFFTWGAFVLVVVLIIWGLIAAQNKATREASALILPDQIVAADHTRGDANAPVTLVEYGDFQCPACGSFYPIVEQVIAGEATSTLRFVFRHFPLSQHANAIPAAEAAEAADRQGKFWEMYHILYEKQHDWENALDAKVIFVGYAKDLGLDENKFKIDMEDKDILEKINNDFRGGNRAGIDSTPTFFVNGKKIASPQTYEAFKKIIDDAVSGANS